MDINALFQEADSAVCARTINFVLSYCAGGILPATPEDLEKFIEFLKVGSKKGRHELSTESLDEWRKAGGLIGSPFQFVQFENAAPEVGYRFNLEKHPKG